MTQLFEVTSTSENNLSKHFNTQITKKNGLFRVVATLDDLFEITEGKMVHEDFAIGDKL